jgi:inosine-uridine nucleoside N-ribohydrolase
VLLYQPPLSQMARAAPGSDARDHRRFRDRREGSGTARPGRTARHAPDRRGAFPHRRRPEFELVDWEATLAHGIPFADLAGWLAADNPRARFYDAISRKTREWMRHTRDITHWHAADGLAMAAVLDSAAAEHWETRAVKIELDGVLTRGMTVVDWAGYRGWRVQSRILMRYRIDRFAEMIRAALS